MTSRIALIVSDIAPFPTDVGNKQVFVGDAFYLLRAGYAVIFITLNQSTKQISDSFETISTSESVYKVRWIQFPRRENKNLIGYIQKLEPALILFEYAHLSRVAAKIKSQGTKIWFRSHNFEVGQTFVKSKHQIPGFRHPLRTGKKLFQLVSLLAQVFYSERLMVRLADKVWHVSLRDQVVMRIFYGHARKQDWLIPFFERPKIELSDRRPIQVLYISNNYSSPTQTEGAKRMIESIIPTLNQECPGVFDFHFVGKESQSFLKDYHYPNVTAHGYLEELSDFIKQMDIICIPVEIGWGCKIRLLESMASGLPVVGSKHIWSSLPAEVTDYHPFFNQSYLSQFKHLISLSNRKQLAFDLSQLYEKWTALCEKALL